MLSRAAGAGNPALGRRVALWAALPLWVPGLLTLTLTAGCASPNAPTAGAYAKLVMPVEPNYVTSGYPSAAGRSWVHGSLTVCLDRPGEVTVTDVTVLEGDLEVTGWALRDGRLRVNTGFVGDLPGTVASNAIPNTNAITEVCADNSYEVIVQLKAGTKTTEARGFVVHYESSHGERTLELPERLIVCVNVDVCKKP